eukprot:1664965-Rhodomonas_salina.1
MVTMRWPRECTSRWSPSYRASSNPDTCSATCALALLMLVRDHEHVEEEQQEQAWGWWTGRG